MPLRLRRLLRVPAQLCLSKQSRWLMRLLLLFLLVAPMLALLPSCAQQGEEDPNRVSTIPWNRPEKWEGQGPLGGMTPNSQ